MKTKRTGILGGSFDPVHTGHVKMASSFLASGEIDQLWVMPTPEPPHKPDQLSLGFEDRFSLVASAFSEMKHVRVSDFEQHLPPPHYTQNTLTKLKEAYTHREFILCIGQDSLNSFHTWKDSEQILMDTKLLVASRPGSEKKHIPGNVIFAEHSPVDISSTEIREAIQSGKDTWLEMVPRKVADIIISKNLYK